MVDYKNCILPGPHSLLGTQRVPMLISSHILYKLDLERLMLLLRIRFEHVNQESIKTMIIFFPYFGPNVSLRT